MQNAELLKKQLEEHRQQDKNSDVLLKLAFVLTFGFYIMFGMNLYLGDPLMWPSYFEKWQSTAGFIFMAALVFLLSLFLAWVKHHAYLYFGLYGSIPLILVTVIGFALFAEFFTASANQDAKTNIMLDNNEAYQQTIATPAPLSAGNSGLSVLIATAQQQLARCNKRLELGKEKYCDGDQAKLDGLIASEKRILEENKNNSVEQQKLNHDRQDKLKADAYNPAIVAVAKVVAGISGGSYIDQIKTAVVFVMLFVAVSFEILHHFLSTSKARAHQTALDLETKLMTENNAHQFNENPVTSPNQDKSWVPFGNTATALSSVNKPGLNISTATDSEINKEKTPATFKYQLKEKEKEPEKKPIGFVHAVAAKPATMTSQKPTPRAGMQIDIEDQVKPGRMFTPEAQAAQAYAEASPGLINKTIREPEAQKPCTGHVHMVLTGSDYPETGSEKQALSDEKTGSDYPETGVYEEWRAWVEEQAPDYVNAADSRRWIQKRISGSQDGLTTTPKEINNLNKLFFMMACNDPLSRIQLKPDYKPGQRKYLM